MLTYLHVENFALIKSLEIDFDHGLTVLSGETGAGKSIVIGSMNAISGGKLDKSMIRKGSDYALIEMIFVLQEEALIRLKEKYGIDYNHEQELLISRRFNMTGRSVYKVNHQTVTVGVVSEIADMTLDIHSQHEHQSLLDQNNHIDLLDRYVGQGLKTLKDDLYMDYKAYKKLTKIVEEDYLTVDDRKREIDFLKFEINEIQSAHLIEGEDETLSKEFKLLSNRNKILQKLLGVEQRLTQNPEMNLWEWIGHILRDFEGIRHLDEEIEDMAIMMAQIEDMVRDLNKHVENYLEALEADDQSLNEVEERIHIINTLKSKYGHSIEAILAALEEKEKRLKHLENYEIDLEKNKEAIQKLTERLETKCEKISRLRQKAAKEIGKNIETVLVDLNFADAKMEINIEKLDEFGQNGYDQVTFLISTNKNESVQPLTKIASGGELSRVMLAIKSVFAEMDQIGTLVFDEIDSGISGRTAQKVGEKMSILAMHRQIICITHLPQISAMADQHYLIEKSESQNRIETFVRPLKGAEIFQELARLIGGVKITENTLESAKEMKEQATAIKEAYINKA
ncbi:DNA repair protein RecN [Petrocella sp. FN5]|uniref:DNA repair protein RecN n=1 Tax=Petrocella sp. FN5 TaxID=3032002 RepID=UPI0023D9952B|nr:DNA repair protein RecN [Petrocella sp. FN5]MDF1617006.1 DNA repair protein RecN [Petrocella sp. FN5]